MVNTGKWIAKHRIIILILGVLLLIPATIGTIKTRINYDLLSYLPEHLETVKGQDLSLIHILFLKNTGIMKLSINSCMTWHCRSQQKLTFWIRIISFSAVA